MLINALFDMHLCVTLREGKRGTSALCVCVCVVVEDGGAGSGGDDGGTE